jgi:hypothetical protein
MNTLVLVIATALVLVVVTLLIGFLKAYRSQQEKTEQILIQKNEAETRTLLAQQSAERWQQKAEEESSKSQQLTQQLQEELTQIAALKTEKNFLPSAKPDGNRYFPLTRLSCTAAPLKEHHNIGGNYSNNIVSIGYFILKRRFFTPEPSGHLMKQCSAKS